MNAWICAALTVLAAAAPTNPSAAHAPQRGGGDPSFSCLANQGVVERTICASETLSASDRAMALLYSSDRLSAFGNGLSNEPAVQRKTLEEMQGCARRQSNAEVATCLQGRYEQRNYELALAAITRLPERALPVIRRADPLFAPIVEAIAIWASEPENADWSAPALASKRTRILALLDPTMIAILTQKDNSFARSTLMDATGNGIAVRRVDDVLRSPRHFAFFLNVIGPSLDTGDAGGGRAIPCAAIVGHPALLAATWSVFGSTMDNFVLNTDCEATLPPTPALATLSEKLNGAWPTCDGTIRFAAYRTYGVSIDAARLGISQHDAAPPPRRRGVLPSDVAAARTELATYYARYLSKRRTQAVVMAADAVRSIVETAQQCE